MVIIYKVYRTKGAVFLHFTHHPTDSVAVIRVVLAVECHSVITHCKEYSALGNIPTDTLMHDSFQRMLFVSVGILELGMCLVVRLCGSVGHCRCSRFA